MLVSVVLVALGTQAGVNFIYRRACKFSMVVCEHGLTQNFGDKNVWSRKANRSC